MVDRLFEIELAGAGLEAFALHVRPSTCETVQWEGTL
jgi:hypothetical protein